MSFSLGAKGQGPTPDLDFSNHQFITHNQTRKLPCPAMAPFPVSVTPLQGQVPWIIISVILKIDAN
jgi:hypothetical protein